MAINWFSGGISSAIAEAKKRQVVFVVVIEGGTESDKFLSALQGFAREFENKSVCIKISQGSVESQQFEQIYPIFLVPSIYFIDPQNGTNLETTGGHSNSEQILASVKRGLSLSSTSASEASTSEEISREGTSKVVTSEAKPEQTVVKETSAQLSEEEIEEPKLPSSCLQPKEMSMEEKINHSKELIVQKRENDKKAALDKEKQDELNRREAAKSLQKFKENQERQSAVKAAEERRKEKEEERMAREKVKAQIAQDRAEKARKFQAEKEETRVKSEEEARKLAAEEAEKARILAANRSKSSRLQFRLPDGRTQTKIFEADSPLSDVYSFVDREINKGFKEFSLSTTLPIRRLDNEDMTSTLKSLELAPSATLMVMPKSPSSPRNYSVASSGGDVYSYVTLLLTPLTILWQFVASFFSLSSSSENRPSARTDEASTSSSASNRPQTAYKRRSEGATFKREGNVARLNNDNDDDEENGTWNGNSTQQM